MTRRLTLAALVALLAGAAAGAGQAQQPTPSAAPPPPATQTPTFKVQIDYVDVDVLVTDKDGRFVRDLTKDDFEIFEDGKPQSIANFSVVDIPIERADRALYTPTKSCADTATNERAFEGRIYVMILDEPHVEALRSQNVRIAARQFIERRLGANDIMAVVHAEGATDSSQEFTNNKRLLLASVDKFMGSKLLSVTVSRSAEYYRQADLGLTPTAGTVGDPFDQERAYKAQQSLRLLKNVAEWFSEHPRPPEDDPLLQRGHRLRHLQPDSPVRFAGQLFVRRSSAT